MILPDFNVLIVAFRESDPQHRLCNAWLTKVIAGDAAYGISPLALAAVVRVTTNRRTFAEANSLERVFAFCDYITDQPHCQIVTPGDRHWNIFSRLCIDANTTGAMVSDAWYAALAIEWGCEWITLDRDYARFPGLKWSTPQA